jgi:hypothetical protein
MLRNGPFLLIPALLLKKKGDAQGLGFSALMLGIKGSFNLFLYWQNFAFYRKIIGRKPLPSILREGPGGE